MISIEHPLLSFALGTARHVVSQHFGPTGAAKKAYLQAALHADEPPGLLVAAMLRERLQQLEQQGLIEGEIVLVPVANPIGLAQWLDHSHIGRFELASGDNFNRHYPDLTEAAAATLNGQLTDDMDTNRALVKTALREAALGVVPTTELTSLRKTLLCLAVDADIVLDLHCDAEAALHLYTGTPLWPDVEMLARYMGATATLLETESGDFPFDEACSRSWWILKERFRAHPIPHGCTSVTVELRGTQDVSYHTARDDANAIIHYLAHRGLIRLTPETAPPLVAPATPLAGSEPLLAPHSGVVVFHRKAGETVQRGDKIFDVIDPISGACSTVCAGTAGVLYARDNRRFAHAAMRLAKIAGANAYRTGKLLSE